MFLEKRPKVFLLLVLTFAAISFAQEGKEAKKEPATKDELIGRVFTLRYIKPQALAPLMGQLGAGSTISPELNAISVRTTRETMPAIEEAIKRLDVPSALPQSIELTVNVLAAAEQQGTPAQLPADLEPVVKQMRASLAYKNYRLLDTIVVRGTEGNWVETSGMLPDQAGAPAPTNYQFRTMLLAANGESGRVIRLTGLKFGFKVLARTGAGGNSFQLSDIGINTDIDAKEGQKVVVGKASAGDTAYILVITARVVN